MNSDSKRAILAVVLSGVILFGWQYFFGQTQPYNVEETKASQVTNSAGQEVVKANAKTEGVPKKVKVEVKTIEVVRDNFKYVINNRLDIINASGELAKRDFKAIFPEDNFSIKFKREVDYLSQSFQLSKVNDYTYDFISEDSVLSGQLTINEKGFLAFKISGTQNFKTKMIFKAEVVDASALGGFGGKNFVYLDQDLETFSVDSDERGDAKIKWFGLDFDFHFFGILLSDENHYLYKIMEDGVMEVRTAKASNAFSFDTIYTQKNYDQLLDLGNKLELTIDFGIWSIIAVPILRGLQFFFTLFPNWGFAVILLTITIRMLTFPLQYKSFKSMKKMQVIQPELKKLKEKFKDDPKRQQMETMALFKKSGANPIGGCLPMLLQMPIFFAFYKVLYSSVELVGAPFIFWITDLSLKDPYYVLPVLMGLSMFFSQKLTPMTTTDPAQKKIMMFMPVIFSFMMFNLPAALTLYIFVSTLVGMLQQIFVFKRT